MNLLFYLCGCFFLQGVSVFLSFLRGFFTILLIKYFFARTEAVPFSVVDNPQWDFLKLVFSIYHEKQRKYK